MSFQSYDFMNDSGVEWLGEVPSHWKVAPIKQGFDIVSGSTPKSDNETYWDGGILWVTPADLSQLSTFYISASQRTITEDGLASCGTTLVPPGSIVLSTRAPIGSLAISAKCLCTNQGCKSLVPRGPLDSLFTSYLLSICTVQLNLRGKGTTFLELSGDELSAFQVPFPSLPEQTAIATFLDRETSKIDGLINEQTRLIELLKEKRHAVISHAVTKGLNPDAPMKDSGVEWLGEVPEGWEVKPLKHVGMFKGGAGFPDAEQGMDGEELPFYKVNALARADDDGYLTPDENTISRETAERLRAFVFPPETIVFAKIGAALLLGRIRLLREPACIDNNLMGFTVSNENSVGFIQYLMGLLKFDLIVNPGAVPSLNQSQIDVIAFGFPSIDEQTAIAAYLAVETRKIGGLIAEAQSAITLLQERRSALISAAVTGKIDVRGLISNQAEAA